MRFVFRSLAMIFLVLIIVITSIKIGYSIHDGIVPEPRCSHFGAHYNNGPVNYSLDSKLLSIQCVKSNVWI